MKQWKTCLLAVLRYTGAESEGVRGICRYWKFTAGKRWDQQRKKAPRSPAAEAVRPRSTGAPEEALRAQLAGLRRKAAFRARSRPPSPAHQPGTCSIHPNAHPNCDAIFLQDASV